MDISQRIIEICRNRYFVLINNHPHYFSFPNLKVQSQANQLYNQELKKLIRFGCLSQKQLLKLSIERGIYTKEEDTEYKRLLKFMRELNQKYRSEIVFFQKKNLKKILRVERKKFFKIISKRQIALSRSAENYAERKKVQFLISECVLDLEENRYWQDMDDILNLDLGKYREIFGNYILKFSSFLNGLHEGIIRFIAHSNEWQLKYLAVQNTKSSLFEKSVSEWDINQINLCYWAGVYRSVLNSLEKPPDIVIKNDFRFDIWLAEQEKKMVKTIEESKRPIQPIPIRPGMGIRPQERTQHFTFKFGDK